MIWPWHLIGRSLAAFREAYPHAAGYSHETMIPRLIALHDQLLASSVHVLKDDNLVATAFARASDNRRPARKGGGASYCLLFEEFRSIARAVPEADPLVLLSTNPEDFTDKAKGVGVIHQEITDGLAGDEAQLCLNWEWAASLDSQQRSADVHLMLRFSAPSRHGVLPKRFGPNQQRREFLQLRIGAFPARRGSNFSVASRSRSCSLLHPVSRATWGRKHPERSAQVR